MENVYEYMEAKNAHPKRMGYITIEAAVSYGDRFAEVDNIIENYSITSQLPDGHSQKEQIRKTSGMLSKELLYMKFLQGVPVVDAVGVRTMLFI